MLAALPQHRTRAADRLRGRVTIATGGPALTFGMEEHVGVLAPAGAVELPVPQISNRTRQPGDLCHQVPFVRHDLEVVPARPVTGEAPTADPGEIGCTLDASDGSFRRGSGLGQQFLKMAAGRCLPSRRPTRPAP